MDAELWMFYGLAPSQSYFAHGRYHASTYRVEEMATGRISATNVITALAAEQWSSARQSVADFKKSRFVQQNCIWSIMHAFFADMGGFVLREPSPNASLAPRFKDIPIDAVQILWLAEKGHVHWPDISEEQIRDKNKADGFARLLTVIQIVWFGISCLGHAAQRLPISCLELGTIAYVFCTIPTFLFWSNKPLDAETVEIIHATTSMADILAQSDSKEATLYNFTPLDFINPPQGLSLLSLFWDGFGYPFLQRTNDKRPAATLPNRKATPPRGLSALELAVGAFIGLGYTGIHIIRWNFHFPTDVELLLWRISGCIIVGMVVVYPVVLAVITFGFKKIAKALYGIDANVPSDLRNPVPASAQTAVFAIASVLYTTARLYIIIEAFTSLRAQPMGVYMTVEWNNFLPHF
ncbi:hypothetical protein LTR95_005873 [Oleoguttula sp. CCFEE 5521]